MKRKDNNEYVNEGRLRGEISFLDDSNEKIITFGVKAPYKNHNNNISYAFVTVKAFPDQMTDEMLECIEVGNEVDVVTHFQSSSYEDKDKKKRISVSNILVSIAKVN